MQASTFEPKNSLLIDSFPSFLVASTTAEILEFSQLGYELLPNLPKFTQYIYYNMLPLLIFSVCDVKRKINLKSQYFKPQKQVQKCSKKTKFE